MLADDVVENMVKFVTIYDRQTDWDREQIDQIAKQRGIDDALKVAGDMVHNNKLNVDDILAAQRFVLSPLVVEASDDFADSAQVVQSTLDYVFLPAENTWMEWREGRSGNAGTHRHGLLLTGAGEGHAGLSVGSGLYTCDVRDPDDGREDFTQIFFEFDLHDFIIREKFKGTPESQRMVKRLGRFLVCVLALINTPRISHLIEHNVDEKLNRSRLKRGKFPLLSWHDVTIRPDVGWAPRATHEEGSTGEKRRHHVRTFMRLKRGKVEIVKPHWRGNREKGYVIHRHVVRMGDEEAGAWKGEPLPGTRILKPGDPVPEES